MITRAPDSRATPRVANLDARVDDRTAEFKRKRAEWRQRQAEGMMNIAGYDDDCGPSMPLIVPPSKIERLTAWYSRSRWVGYALLAFGIACFALAGCAAVVGWRIR